MMKSARDGFDRQEGKTKSFALKCLWNLKNVKWHKNMKNIKEKKIQLSLGQDFKWHHIFFNFSSDFFFFSYFFSPFFSYFLLLINKNKKVTLILYYKLKRAWMSLQQKWKKKTNKKKLPLNSLCDFIW